MRKIIAGIRLLRPMNCMIGAMAVFVSGAITQSLGQTQLLIQSMLVVFLFNGGANAINDVHDIDIDKINRPTRPLSSNSLSKKTGLWIAVVCFSTGGMLALTLPTFARIIALILALPVLVFYTTHLKNKPIIGNMAVAVILGLVFLFGGAVFSAMEPMIIPAALAVLLTFLRELVKDMEDVEGDSALGLRTYPVTVGLERAKTLARWWALATAIILLIPVWLAVYNTTYLWIVILGIHVPLLYLIISFSKQDINPASISYST